ncbi:hypothetical protein BGX29_002394 [Mortierella sp. GBA35]|nr:hypothetical protein BGX29_002394 [Mortierella sp. GBA35]
MSCYQCAVCSLPFHSHIASMYCSERCYIVDGMAYYYQSFSTTAAQSSLSPTTATTTASSWASWPSSSCDAEPADQSPLIYFSTLTGPVRKNKTLPPPTLSPILMSTLPSPSQSSRRSTKTRSRSSSMLSASSCSADSASCCSSMNTSVTGGSSDGEDDPLSGNWPRMDRFIRGSTGSFDRHLSSNGRAQWDPVSLGWTTTDADEKDHTTRSELPLAPSYLQSGDPWEEDLMLSSAPRKYLALSASIWGPGWHQVEPLPPSFVKTLEQSELELQAQAQALALEKAALAAANPKTIAKKAKREAKAAALAAAAAEAAKEQGKTSQQDTVMADTDSCQTTSTASDTSSHSPPSNALCSSRLPRSLQFVD